jgi:hypothetical protein
MDIRYRFPFKRRFILEDVWPLEGHGAVVEFEREGREVTHVVVTFRDQPLNKAPKITTSNTTSKITHIEMRDDLQVMAELALKRFQAFVSIHQ